MQEKLAITVIVITLALFALIYIIYRIIDQNQDSYNQIVLSQQEYDSRVIPYRRGDIVDRNGTYLATTEKVYNLIIDPKQILEDEENYLEPTVSALVAQFGYDAQEIRSLILENPDRRYIRYARQLPYEDKDSFETMQTETNTANNKAGDKKRIKGVWFEDEYRRIYPNNALACNVIGFANSDGKGGNGGIEQSYNDSLIGTNGREYGYLNDDSNLERVIKPAVNGNTIVSTIDVNIQNVVEKRISQWMAETGSEHAGVVVMDPDSGEVLAMANDKTFDLNNPRAVSDRYTEEELTALGTKEAVNVYKNEHRKTDGAVITEEEVPEHFTAEEVRSYGTQVAWNQEWRNFCISDAYEPGSPSKIFTVAAALEEGVVNSGMSFFCDGFQTVADYDIKCTAYGKGGHGNLTLEETLMQSCNDAMMQIAARMGGKTFSRYQQMFGFGSKTGIDLPGEADTKTLVYPAEKMGPTELATNSFGQTYNCTMIQMAAGYCSVINGGSYYEPHVVKQILNEQGSVVRKNSPQLVRETVSEGTAAFIREALFETVELGTGKAAQVAGYQVAGKTGTAEKFPRKQGKYLVSFCGFAPADDPQVLVYVVIDEPHVEDQAHSTYASAVFSQIMGDILPYLNVFPEITLETSEEIAAQLPAEEGISDIPGGGQAEETQAPKVYDTEEYVSPEVGQDSGIPDSVPAGAMESAAEALAQTAAVGETGSETAGQAAGSDGGRAETTGRRTEAETTKRQTEAETTRRQTKAETTRRQTEAETTRRQTAAETTRRQTEAETTRRQTEAETTRRQTEAATTAAPSESAGGQGHEPVGDQPGDVPIIAPHPEN